MNNELTVEYHLPKIDGDILDIQMKKAEESYHKLLEGEYDMTGWIDYPANISSELLTQITDMADHMKKNFSAVVVVGIGGSYLGAKAALDFIKRDQAESNTKVIFAGRDLSTVHHNALLKRIENENLAVLIISKSGGTTETLVAGNIFMEYIEEKYGKKAMKERIFLVTDPEHGRLRKMADEEGYASLPIPGDIGGRYSVLTTVGLLPMAIAGIDIRAALDGAVSAGKSGLMDKAKKLAAVRNIQEESGYSVEIFADFNPYMTSFIKWIKQLYGESEGKDGKGMLPVNMEYSKDLHSLGQFVQQGRQSFIENIVNVKDELSEDINISKSWGISDRDLTMADLNDAAKNGVIAAHKAAGVPVLQIEIPKRDAYFFGQSVYFFQMSCAMRAVMMGVDPFNQPGVEKYKEEMNKYLKNQ